MREQIAHGQDPLEVKATEAAKPRMPQLREAAEFLHKELTPGWKNVKHAQQWWIFRFMRSQHSGGWEADVPDHERPRFRSM